MAETPEAVRAALEAGVRAWCDPEFCFYPHCETPETTCEMATSVPAAIAAFLRALPTGNGYSPHDLAAAVDACTVTKEPSNG